MVYDSPLPPERPASDFHWPSLLQLIVSLGGSLLALLVTVVLAASAVTNPGSMGLSMLILAWASGLVSGLLFLSVYYAFRRLRGRPAAARPDRGRFVLASAFMLLWPLLAAGAQALYSSSLAGWLLPPVLLAGVGIPILWYLEFGRRGLPVARPQRTWGLFAFTAIFSLPLIMVVELLAIAIILTGLGLWLQANPSVALELQALLERLSTLPEMGPDALLELLGPLATQPVVIYGLLFVIAVLAPLVEETFKPLGMFLLGGKKLNPAQGLWAGMVCGASFALLETLGTLSSAAEAGPLFVLAGRFGTGLLHIVTAGLTGWGLASVWSGGSYLKLLGSYAAALSIHAAWNVFGLLWGFSPLAVQVAGGVTLSDPLLRALSAISLPALVLLAVFNLIILWRFNRSLRPAAEPAEEEVEPDHPVPTAP